MTYGQLPEPIVPQSFLYCHYAVKGGHGRRRRAA